MSTSNITKSQGFTTHGEKGQLRSRIDRHILVICPQAYLMGSFDRSRNLLAFSGAYNALENWSEDFLEDNLALEPFLQIQKQKLSIFIAPGKSLLIPRPLFRPEHGKDWFHQVHFEDQEDLVGEWILPQAKIHLLYSYPLRIQELLGRLFPGRLIHPLTAPLLRTRAQDGAHLDALFIDQKVYMSHWDGTRLLGLYDFEIDGLEELAYRIMQIERFHQQPLHQIAGLSSQFPQDSRFDLTAVASFLPAHTQREGVFLEPDHKESKAMALLEELILCV